MSNYYVSGCVADGDDVATCDDSVAQFWTLYHRNDQGLSEGIIDCMFREDAEAAMRVYEQRDAMAAENVMMRIAIDHTIGWQESVDAGNTESVRSLHELETPATDAYLNSVRAESIHFAANRMLAAWDSGFIDDTPAQAYDISGAVLSSVEFLPNASPEELKRDFADSILSEIKASTARAGKDGV